MTPEFEIVFDTLKTTRKYRNLLERPACSFVVGWDGEQTIQFEGIAKLPGGQELVGYQQVYFAAWPAERARIAWPEITYIVVQPTWIRYSDYGQSPPLIKEITFPG